MALPQFQGGDVPFQLMQNAWATQINPVLGNPLLKGNLLRGLALNTGANVINHLLSRKQQGWVLTDATGTATLYRSAPFNTLTLELTASAPITVDLLVY